LLARNDLAFIVSDVQRGNAMLGKGPQKALLKEPIGEFFKGEFAPKRRACAYATVAFS
jgi:hypothetical protein